MIRNFLLSVYGKFLLLILSGVLLPSVASAASYYISPNGNDTNNGSSQTTPVKTFNRAWQLIYPGDTLFVMNGTYYDSISPNKRNGRPNPDLPLNTDTNGNGTPDIDEPDHRSFIPYDDPIRTARYIRIKALNDGQATIDGEYQRTPIFIANCSPPSCSPDNGESPLGNYFIIEGLIARHGITTTVTTLGHHNVFKRISSYNTLSTRNNHGISAGTGSIHNLFEDCISAGSGRKSIFAYASHYSIFRRCFTYWQEWDGREQFGTEWPWGNAAEMYNSSSGIIENIMAIGAYPEVAFGILSNVANSASPMPASNNKILGSAVIHNGMHPDGTAWRWPMARPMNPPDTIGPLKRYWEWKDQRSGINLHTWGENAQVNNNRIQDVFIFGGMGIGLTTSYDSNDEFSGNQIDHVTLLNNKQDTTFPDTIDGIKGTDMISERVTALTVTNSRIGRVCTENAKTNPTGCTTQIGEGARLANRYINGILTNTPLWPWPMQDRIIKEIGYDITGSMTDIFISQNTPTGNSIKAPLVSPIPPLGNPLQTISGATYLSPVTVTFSLPTGAASIKYTTDGSIPTSDSTLYTSPFTLNATTLVKALAFTESGQAGHLRSAYYRISPGGINLPPTVTAADGIFVSRYSEIVLPKNSVPLYGTVEDYTLPQSNSTVSSTWSSVSGPGSVSFGNPNVARTTATFTAPGLYSLRLTASDGTLTTMKDIEVRVWPADMVGVRHAIPGRIEAENYSSAVEGQGHHQVKSYGDALYRPGSPVDVTYVYNDTAGFALTHLYQTEWLAYLITVAQTGPYTLNVRYATANSNATGGIIHFELDGQNISGPVTLTNTGNSYLGYGTTSGIGVGTLTAGNHTLKLVVEQAPPTAISPFPLNSAINYFELVSGQGITPSPSGIPKQGDANADNRVDGLDYVIWLNHYGGIAAGITSGDFNSDSRIDGLDYVVWLNHYGT